MRIRSSTSSRFIRLATIMVTGAVVCSPIGAKADEDEPREPPADAPSPVVAAPPEQPAEPTLDATGAGAPAEKDPTAVTDQGVPPEEAASEEAVPEVQEAVEKVEAAAEVGIPKDFVIEFGDNHDWIQFKAGEWLKGELKWMRQRDVEFDSKKLKLMQFKWSDIVQLHAPRIKTYVFEGNVVAIGRAVVTREQVIVETIDGVKVFPRDELVSIVRGEPRERNYWSTRLRAGLTGTAGNSEQVSLNAYWRLRRADRHTRSFISYEGTFASAAREETVNRHVGEAAVRVFLWRRFYLTPFTMQLLNDRFQNLRLRATPSVAAGAHLFDTSKVEWLLEGGPGYQYTNGLSTPTDVKNPQHDGLLVVHTFLKWTFIPDNKLEIDWRTNLVYTQIGLTNHVGQVRLKLKVVSIFEFETEFTFFRTESPVARENGTVPKSNDYQLVVGLVLTLNE